MKEMGRRELRIIGTVALIAAVVRIILFMDYLESPFRYFHTVQGLDMKTLLYWSEWGNPEITPFYTHFRALAALFWNITGHHTVEHLAFVQLLCGIVTAMAVTYIAWHLWKERISALAAGVIAGCYAPALMYELSMLQETLQLLSFTLSFAALLWARKHHFRPVYATIWGCMLGLALVGRPTTILWTGGAFLWAAYVLWSPGRKWKKLLRLTWGVAGLFVILLLASSFNYHHWKRFSPFPTVLSNSALLNNMAEVQPIDENDTQGEIVLTVSRTEAVAGIIRRAAARVPLLFRSHEVPDNLNYYFIRDHVPSLKFMPGPGILVPLAVAGGLLLIFSARFLRREGVILLALASLALPLCANYPMGRYRLILLPLFALLAVSAFRAGILWKPRKVWLPATLAVAAGAFLINPLQTEPFYRSSDFISWALAQEQPEGNPNRESVETLAQGYNLGGSESAGMNLLIRLIPLGEFDTAQGLIADMLARGSGNSSQLRFYAGLIHMEQGNFAAAEAALSTVDVETLDDPARFYFLRGELARRQNRPEEMRRFFLQVLTLPGGEQFRTMIEPLLK